jgi:cytochrome c-type biogenesis protein CcmE
VTGIRRDDDPGSGHGFDESPELDLSPRTTGPAAGSGRSRRRRPIGAYAVLAVVALGIGFVVFQGLGSATLYFRNADEALAQRDDLGTRRFRLQGLVEDDVVQDGESVRFTVAFNGAAVTVIHHGDPPDLFSPNRPVVLEGHFVEGSDTFASDRILVKHSEEYEAEHDDRIVEGNAGHEEQPAP